MQIEVTVTASQAAAYELYKKGELSTKRAKECSWLFERIDKNGYTIEKRLYNTGMEVMFYFNGERLTGKVFAMKENDAIGGFGILVRVGERVVEFRQSELVRIR